MKRTPVYVHENLAVPAATTFLIKNKCIVRETTGKTCCEGRQHGDYVVTYVGMSGSRLDGMDIKRVMGQNGGGWREAIYSYRRGMNCCGGTDPNDPPLIVFDPQEDEAPVTPSMQREEDLATGAMAAPQGLLMSQEEQEKIPLAVAYKS